MTDQFYTRYSYNYRSAEMHLIYDCTKQGQSLCFVGIAGIGKSNISNFLNTFIQNDESNFSIDDTRAVFPIVDGNTWDQTPIGLWKLMLAALMDVAKPLDQPEADDKLIQLSEEQKAFSQLKGQVDWFCQKRDQSVMVILDDFDKVLTVGPLAMLEQLNALRSGGNRGKLSYLLFTKKLPHVLGRAHPLKGTSKFYDLFSNHIYALGLYNHEDARQMLLHLNELAGKPLSTRELALIQSFTGGHARLIRLVFELWRTHRPDEKEPIADLAAQGDVRDECQRILNGLHDEEQGVVLRLAQGTQKVEDQPVIDHLVRRGLLYEGNDSRWFSPLFAEFLQARVG